MKYLFMAWPRIQEKIRDKNLFIFLDFDGTLAPIVSRPQKAALPKGARSLFVKLMNNPKIKLAFISGRSLEDIRSKVGIRSAIYSGNHGLQLAGAGPGFKPLIPSGYRIILTRVKQTLTQKLSSIPGVLIEDKGVVLSLHYRRAEAKSIPLVKKIFHATMKRYRRQRAIKVKAGKMVLEVQPLLQWNKGTVVAWLLRRKLFASPKAQVMPIYIGDDTTDEDAFGVVKNKGLAVVVGQQKKTQASYYLNDHREVYDFLKRILATAHS